MVLRLLGSVVQRCLPAAWHSFHGPSDHHTLSRSPCMRERCRYSRRCVSDKPLGVATASHICSTVRQSRNRWLVPPTSPALTALLSWCVMTVSLAFAFLPISLLSFIRTYIGSIMTSIRLSFLSVFFFPLSLSSAWSHPNNLARQIFFIGREPGAGRLHHGARWTLLDR